MIRLYLFLKESNNAVAGIREDRGAYMGLRPSAPLIF